MKSLPNEADEPVFYKGKWLVVPLAQIIPFAVKRIFAWLI
tara:strand:+ start:281 stop:400 length:120 start_codon:yes stop_codon:yes gene_type:complete